ncbi:MAG: PQQ-binding-like beta-propeller repeat protein, partial [Umezawaea sp.]
DPVTPAAVVGRPTGGTWEWRAPSAPVDVVAAGAGVVVATAGGEVTALDGRSGTVRWSHVRRGAHVRALVTTPGGGMVLVAFAPGGPRDTGAELLVVLDAVTGSVVREQVVDGILSDVDGFAPTAEVLPLRERRGDGEFGTTAVDLRTGRQLWTWSAPPGCRSEYVLPASGRDVALAPFECSDRIGVAALDQRDGHQRWEHTVRLDPSVTTDEAPRISLAASPDGEVLSLRLSSPKATTASDVLVRADTGALLTSVDNGLFPRVATGPVPVLELQDGARPTRSEAVDPRTGTRTALDLSACPSRIADATTTSTYLRVCGTGDDTELVWQDLAGGPAASAPIDWRATGAEHGRLLGGGSTALVPAPGAIVAARATGPTVVGFPTGGA